MKFALKRILFVVSLLTIIPNVSFARIDGELQGCVIVDNLNSTGVLENRCCRPQTYMIDTYQAADGPWPVCATKSLLDFVNNFFFKTTSNSGDKHNEQSEPDTLKPTPERCRGLATICGAKAVETQSSCQGDRLLAELAQVNANLTCHGNPQDIIDSLPDYDPLTLPLGPTVGLRCELYELTQKTNKAQWCITNFRLVALKECLNGTHQTTTVQQEGIQWNFPLGELGQFSASAGKNVTIVKGANQGTYQYCAAVAEKHKQACEQAKQDCLSQAESTSVQRVNPNGQEVKPQTKIDQIISRIDRKLLSIDRPWAEGSFRSISRDVWENSVLYESRIEFLADWSELIKAKRMPIPEKAQAQAQKAFRRCQIRFHEIYNHLTELMVSALVLNDTWDHNKAEEAMNKLEAYTYSEASSGGPMSQFELELFSTEKTLERGLKSALGPVRTQWFYERVWPGLNTFAFAEPMLVERPQK